MIRPALLLLALAVGLHAEWITPKGKSFHVRQDCIALRSTKQPVEITRAEAEKRGLRICGICSRWKKPAKEGK